MHTECEIRMTARGERLQPMGILEMVEDLEQGAHLRFHVHEEDLRRLDPGTPIELEIRDAGPDGPGSEGTFKLWVVQVSMSDDGARREVTVDAVDPLAFCRQRQLISHPGR